ncbi:MAG TPA: hypothetical protein VGW74_09375 [Propionibacteriaceae bacterium]|nr:hypothetical protein [Propionibacteriaceae bacterium]
MAKRNPDYRKGHENGRDAVADDEPADDLKGKSAAYREGYDAGRNEAEYDAWHGDW